MTKHELETVVRKVLGLLENAPAEAKESAIEYGKGIQNSAYEVGYLSGVIKEAVAVLKETELMSNKELFG